MKSNDKIPKDELLLAELIAVTTDAGLVSVGGSLFVNAYSEKTFKIEEAIACCAEGAMILAGYARIPDDISETDHIAREMSAEYCNLRLGNDLSHWLGNDDNDHGESAGWAFREALRDDDVV